LTTALRFPVPGLGTILRSEWSLVNGEHRALEPGPATLSLLVRAPLIPPGAPRRAMPGRDPRWSQQRRSGLIDGPVDGLVAQPNHRLVRMKQPKMPADLLWAPPLRQQLGHPGHVALGWCRGAAEADGPGGRSPAGAPRTAILPTCVLRRNSREIVDGARPRRSAIPRPLTPARRRSAISIRALISRTASRSSGATKPTPRRCGRSCSRATSWRRSLSRHRPRAPRP
jgi:hypothetical protein